MTGSATEDSGLQALTAKLAKNIREGREENRYDLRSSLRSSRTLFASFAVKSFYRPRNPLIPCNNLLSRRMRCHWFGFLCVKVSRKHIEKRWQMEFTAQWSRRSRFPLKIGFRSSPNIPRVA